MCQDIISYCRDSNVDIINIRVFPNPSGQFFQAQIVIVSHCCATYLSWLLPVEQYIGGTLLVNVNKNWISDIKGSKGQFVTVHGTQKRILVGFIGSKQQRLT